MKKFLISLHVLIFVVAFMCIYMRNTRRDASNVQKFITYDDSDYKFDYKVITIDGREYIATKTHYGYVTLCPKLSSGVEK